MKMLIFGGKGFMGRRFAKAFPDALCPPTDIADDAAVQAILEKERPDVVINCAGKTGVPNVDWCETHQDETVRSNVTGPFVLFHELRKRGIYGVHMSSGCIYAGDNGGKGFSEEDEPNFAGSFYSKTKALSEEVLRELADPVDGKAGILILRIRMPFDGSTDDRNLITKLKKYSRVLDVQNSITYIPDFLAAAKTLIDRRRTGIWNVVNPGVISPYEIMERYKAIVDPMHSFERLSVEQLGDVVKAGRSNCVLAVGKIQHEGIVLLPVEQAVNAACQRLKKMD